MRMSLIHFRHRFFIRQYVYPCLCILLLIVLVKWHSDKDANRTYGRDYHVNDKVDDMRVVMRPTNNTGIRLEPVRVEPKIEEKVEPKVETKAMVDNDAIARPPINKPSGNVVSLEVYMEAQCPDTSAFIHRHLVPTYARLGHLQRLNVTIVPFGKAECKTYGDDFQCDCQHGQTECELNSLMNCAMEKLVQPRLYIPLIGCIQGSDDIDSAAVKCLKIHPDKDWIVQCARSKRGRYLLALAGRRTAQLGSVFDFVPWVVIDGSRDIDSFYALQENICKRLSPTPAECLATGQPVQAIEQPFRL